MARCHGLHRFTEVLDTSVHCYQAEHIAIMLSSKTWIYHVPNMSIILFRAYLYIQVRHLSFCGHVDMELNGGHFRKEVCNKEYTDQDQKHMK